MQKAWQGRKKENSLKKITLILLLVFCSTKQATALEESEQTIKHYVEGFADKKPKIANNQIIAPNFLKKFYTALNFQPIWTNPETVLELKRLIGQCWQDGLLRKDFHGQALGLVLSNEAPPKLTPDQQDIILTDAYVGLLYQLYFGKLSPNKLDPNWNFKHLLPEQDPNLPTGTPEQVIAKAIKENTIRSLVEKVRISHPYYQGLQRVLKIYTDNANLAEWPVIADGPPLKPGASDPRVPQLRKRLTLVHGFQATFVSDSKVYDPELEKLVRQFQQNHGIDNDGVIGARTLKALNVSPKKRVDQVRVNMERARWALRSLIQKKDLVIVNIAGFYLHLILNGKPVWLTQVITGKTYHKTPIFSDQMEYIVFNPNWNVPPGITRNEMLPKLRKNPQFLTNNNYKLVASNGKTVAPTSINWQQVSGRSFPYRIVQNPGPKNALGRVKFIFPNRHNVYLHDTPGKSLFSKTKRAFSHGCIRVKNPAKLAELILANRNGWSPEKVKQTIAKGERHRVNLTKKLPVAILYWTVDPSFKGQIRFYNDIYGRDARILKALNAQFHIPKQ